MPDVGNLQFSYVGETSSFEKASEKVESRLKKQEELLKKTEKKFLTFNKVVLASGVGLTALAIKKIPKVGSAFKSLSKGTGVLFNSLDKILIASKGFIGPFAKVGAAVSGSVIGFESASFAMDALGVSTGGTVGALVKFGGVASGIAAVGLTGLISLTQQAADALGNSLLSSVQANLDVGAKLETQTFALGLSLDSYRKSTGDASVTTASMVKLLDELGRTTGLTRGELKGGVTQMLNLSSVTGLTADQIKVLVQRAAEMSVALGVDFNEAIQAIDQSFKGYNAQLLNFGININEGTLAQTKFVKSQDRTVDALSASNLALAKFETIMSQSATTAGVLAKANNTINGSALNAELAVESFNNRLGEATQEILGPFIVKMNQVKAAFFDLKGKGGIAKATVAVTVFVGVFAKSIAFILKWGAAVVIARQILKLLGLALRSVGKIIGFFSGALRFMSKMLQLASKALDKLSRKTGQYAIFADIAALSSKGLGVAAGGLAGAANFAGVAAEGATKKFGLLSFSFKTILKVLKVFGFALLGLLGTILQWTGILAVAGVAVLALAGILKSFAKIILRAFGSDTTQAMESFKRGVESASNSLKDFVKDIVTLPERIILSFESITNSIVIAVIKATNLIKDLVGFAASSVRDLEAENTRIAAKIANLGRDPKSGDKSEDKKKFEDSRQLIRARERANFEELKSFDIQKARAIQIAFFGKKILQIDEDIRAIKQPQIKAGEELVELQKRQLFLANALRKESGVNAPQESLDFKARKAAIRKEIGSLQEQVIDQKKNLAKATGEGGGGARLAFQKDIVRLNDALSETRLKNRDILKETQELDIELVAINDKILAKKESINQATIVNEAKIKEVNDLGEERVKLLSSQKELVRDQARGVFELNQLQGIGAEIAGKNLKLEDLQIRNRFKLINAERARLELRKKELADNLAQAQKEAGGKLGGLERAKFEQIKIGLQKEGLILLAKERQLQRDLINELGPLNQKFQEQRSADLRTRLDELALAGASNEELARTQTEAAKQNQREVWQAVSEQSNNALQALEAKMLLYFDDTRTLAQKTSEFMFSVFQSLDRIATSVIKDIATGVASLNRGFKDFQRAVVDLVIGSLVELGIQQAKIFLIQESGFGKILSNIEKEGGEVSVLTGKYNKLAEAKIKASKAGRGSGTTEVPSTSGASSSGVLGSGGVVAGALGAFNSGGFVPQAKDRKNFFEGFADVFSEGLDGPKGLTSVISDAFEGIKDLFSPESNQGLLGNALKSGPKIPGLGGGVPLVNGKIPAAGGLSSVLGGVGLASAGGGLLGGALGGAEGAKRGALGAAIGFVALGPLGGVAGAVLGGLSGRKKAKKRKAEAKAAREAIKEIKELSQALTLESETLDTALSRINRKIDQNTGKAKKAWEDYRDQLEFQRKQLVKQLQEVSKDMKVQIEVLGAAFDLRGVTSQVAGFKKTLEDAIKLISQVESDAAAKQRDEAIKVFEGSVTVLIESLDKALADQEKSFAKGARNDIGELISLADRAVLDLKKLDEDRIKVNKDFNKSIKDIENEGIAQRQKTIKDDKAERIAKLRKEQVKQLLAISNAESTINIVKEEQIALNIKNNKILEDQKQVVIDKAAGQNFLIPGTTPTPGSVPGAVSAPGPEGQNTGARPSLGVVDEDAATKENPIRPGTLEGPPTINIDNNSAVISTPEQNGVLLDNIKRFEDFIEFIDSNLFINQQIKKILPESDEALLRKTALQLGLGVPGARVKHFRAAAVSALSNLKDLFGSGIPLGAKIPPGKGFPQAGPGLSNLPAKAKGGVITKTEPVLIHKGEFVVQEQFAQRMLPLLQSMNRGQIPVARPSGGRRGSSDGVDMSINVTVGSVDSTSRVQEIEKIVTRLQRRQLNSVRQMVNV